MQRYRKALVLSSGVAVTVVAALLLYGNLRRGATAHASPAPELLSALPVGAPTLFYLDLAELRASSFYQHRPDKGPIAVPNQDYRDFVRSTGFDFEKDLDRVVIASWPAVGKEQKRNIVIADGRFDRAKIRDYATRKGKVDHQQGHEVFLFPTGDGMGFNTVTFLSDHRIALVAGPSIAPLFAPPSGDAAGDPARDRAARVDGASMFVVSRVPAIPDKIGAGSGAGAMQSAQLAALARSVQWITFAARPEGDNLRLSIEGECTTSSDAAQLRAALELVRVFARAALESPKTRQNVDAASLAQFQNLLSTAEVTQAAERVRILIELTPDIFKVSGPAKTPLAPVGK